MSNKPTDCTASEWPDRTWLPLLKPAFKQDSELANSAARLFEYLIGCIGSRKPKDRQRAIDTLRLAQALAFDFSPEYKLLYQYYRVSLATGDLPIALEPINALTDAFDKAISHLESLKRKHAKLTKTKRKK